MYVELGSASLYVTVDGSTASWSGRIGGKEEPGMVSDREYSRYRVANPAVELIDSDAKRVILRSARGMEEEWLRPRWALVGVRRARAKSRPTK